MSFFTQSNFSQTKTLPLKQYVYLSTVFGVFTGAFFIKIGFDVQFFYILIISNLFLMTFLVRSVVLPSWIALLMAYLTASGVIGIVRGTDTVGQFLKQFVGISLSSIYFFYFFKIQNNDVDRTFQSYLRIANWITYIGFAQCAIMSYATGGFARLQSIMGEPAGYATLILPAYYWYAYCCFFKKTYRRDFIVTTVAILLSQSSLAFIGVAFGLVLIFSRRKLLLAVAPLVIAVLVGLFYVSSYQFSVRANDTVTSLTSNDVTDTNISTYALISNFFVTEQVLSESPILGNGLGSHVISHERFIGTIPGVENFIERGEENFNSTEAASLALRSLSELGIVGFLGIICFLVYFHVGGTSDRGIISNALLVCFFVKLVRIGTYFPPEQFFFIFIYILNCRYNKAEVAAIKHKSGVDFREQQANAYS
jgi:hypothetical protein